MVRKFARSLSALCEECELFETYTRALTSAVKMQSVYIEVVRDVNLK